MAFEIVEKDLLGRIGRLETKSGTIETPLLLPVINPLIQPNFSSLLKNVECPAIITNAYLLLKRLRGEVKQNGIHDFLNYDGVVMTDSGAYQILVYGDVDVEPLEIACFEEEIETDIAVILDIPTGWNVSRLRAKESVEETLKRAQLTLSYLTKDEILWVGPIQGGNHLDLITYSAKRIGEMPFHIHALGSPTQVMERYLFDILVGMVMTAKIATPINRPLHLFGAGHPFMFSLAVAMGCDMFDSAAYAIYARYNKYMTHYGTLRLEEIEYFPCACSICSKHSPQELKEMQQEERELLLTHHNLTTCLAEIRRIKQAIREGRLWELLEVRCRSHPSLYTALKRLTEYCRYIEGYSPTGKNKGLFFFDNLGLSRPAVIRHQNTLRSWKPPHKYEVLVLLPQPSFKPFHRSREIKRVLQRVQEMSIDAQKIHFCVYGPPFGLIPLLLDEIYPLSQFEVSHPPDTKTTTDLLKQIIEYILMGDHGCRAIVIHSDQSRFSSRLINECDDACHRAGLTVLSTSFNGRVWNKPALTNLITKIKLTLTSNHEVSSRTGDEYKESIKDQISRRS